MAYSTWLNDINYFNYHIEKLGEKRPDIKMTRMVFTQFVFLIRVQVSSMRPVLAGQFRLWFVSVCFPFPPGSLYQIPGLVRQHLLSAPIEGS